MIRTKHLIVVISLLCVGTSVFFVAMRTAMLPEAFVGMKAELQLGAPIVAVGASLAVDDTRERSRELLKARLRILADSDAESDDQSSAYVGSEPLQAALPELEIKSNGLPLGQGNRLGVATAGYVLSCSLTTEGVSREVPWIRDGRWYPDERPVIDGSAFLESSVSIRIAEGARMIDATGIPPHAIGSFPVSPFDDALAYARGETPVISHPITIQLPTDPIRASAAQCISGDMVGIMLNGVPLRRGIDATGVDVGATRVTDRCDGSTDSTGAYYYVRESGCLLDAHYEGGPSTLLGYALDGFGIFASIENGTKITNANLDTCHGHIHEIPWDGRMVSLYHYHFTDEFPYSIGCFVGVPVAFE